MSLPNREISRSPTFHLWSGSDLLSAVLKCLKAYPENSFLKTFPP